MGRLGKGEFATAMQMLRRNRGRSLLTMSGIIIAVVAVVTIVGIGNGAEQQLNDQATRLGKDLITVRPGQASSGLQAAPVSGTLSTADVQRIQHTKSVGSVTTLSYVSGGITAGTTDQHYDVPVIGADPNLPDMVRQSLAYGTFFETDATGSNKVILGAAVAQSMFDQNVPLGQELTILGKQFIVAGIFSSFQTAPLSLDVDFNNAVFIANDTAAALTNNSAPLYEVLVRPDTPEDGAAVVDRLNGALLAAHGGQHDFSVLTQSQTIAVTRNILDLFTAVVAGVASIALLVGGVGIMNVMLVSVVERMQEIGIRKAVGATNQQILRQFMIEAATLSVIGALIGIVVSFLVEIGLRLATNLTPTITWQAVCGATLVSVIVGVLFGTVPALQAARKEPIAALRNE